MALNPEFDKLSTNNVIDILRIYNQQSYGAEPKRQEFIQRFADACILAKDSMFHRTGYQNKFSMEIAGYSGSHHRRECYIADKVLPYMKSHLGDESKMKPTQAIINFYLKNGLMMATSPTGNVNLNVLVAVLKTFHERHDIASLTPSMQRALQDTIWMTSQRISKDQPTYLGFRAISGKILAKTSIPPI